MQNKPASDSHKTTQVEISALFGQAKRYPGETPKTGLLGDGKNLCAALFCNPAGIWTDWRAEHGFSLATPRVLPIPNLAIPLNWIVFIGFVWLFGLW